jgi:hypothetical protein
MTHRDSDQWRLPPRAPQHAVPVEFSRPLRGHAHRALRLFVIAGTWAAGLCLVIGSIVLVTAATGHSRGQPALAMAGQTSLATGNASRLAVAGLANRPEHGGFDVIARFSGHGDETTRQFRIRPHLRWELRWTYSCPAGMAAGQLIVEDAGSTETNGASIDQTGISGAGATWLNSAVPRHSLVVISTCSWTMKAVQAR